LMQTHMYMYHGDRDSPSGTNAHRTMTARVGDGDDDDDADDAEVHDDDWTITVKGDEQGRDCNECFSKPEVDPAFGIESVACNKMEDFVKGNDHRAQTTVKFDTSKIHHFTPELKDNLCTGKPCKPELTLATARTLANGQDYDPAEAGAHAVGGVLGSSVFTYQPKGDSNRGKVCVYSRLTRPGGVLKKMVENKDYRVLRNNDVLHIGAHFTGNGDEDIFTSDRHTHYLFPTKLTEEQIDALKQAVKAC